MQKFQADLTTSHVPSYCMTSFPDFLRVYWWLCSCTREQGCIGDLSVRPPSPIGTTTHFQLVQKSQADLHDLPRHPSCSGIFPCCLQGLLVAWQMLEEAGNSSVKPPPRNGTCHQSQLEIKSWGDIVTFQDPHEALALFPVSCWVSWWLSSCAPKQGLIGETTSTSTSTQWHLPSIAAPAKFPGGPHDPSRPLLLLCIDP